MKITLINGSPKVKSSASGTLIEDLKGYLGEKAEVVEVGFHTATLTREVIEKMAKTEAWVFVYPLYVDGIPGHGPKAPIDKALEAFSETILRKAVYENCYVSVAFPRFLYKMGAQRGWRQMIKANGGRTKDLGKIPE